MRDFTYLLLAVAIVLMTGCKAGDAIQSAPPNPVESACLQTIPISIDNSLTQPDGPGMEAVGNDLGAYWYDQRTGRSLGPVFSTCD